MFNAFPLDMSQHPSLFNTTRIPHREKDILKRRPGTKHFVAQRYGIFYAVDLFDDDGKFIKK